METVLEKLKKNKRLPMHMPGHKRNAAAFRYLKGMAELDITETEGFDDLHNASGILRDSMRRAARLRGADAAFYLVNGSTCGILAAVCAVLKRGDKAVVARNCHRSVYNALEIAGAEPIFVYPEENGEYGVAGSVKPGSVAVAIAENPECRLVIVTSPTYEGVISDIEAICRVAHREGIPVLVDAAHGAHLGFAGFSGSATEQGADISVESLHKTLPSLTQTAVCYLSGTRVPSDRVAKKLAVFETSSPSYILLSSIDGCIGALKEEATFKAWEKGLDYFYKRAEKLKNIRLLRAGKGFFGLDRSKIVLFPENMSGGELAEFLRKAGIEPEMTAPGYVICMTGAGDTKRSLKRLVKALFKADKRSGGYVKPPVPTDIYAYTAMPLCEAADGEKILCDTEKSEGRIAAGYLWAYPPGVPIIVPGERISKETLEIVSEYKKSGIELRGDIINGKIPVIK